MTINSVNIKICIWIFLFVCFNTTPKMIDFKIFIYLNRTLMDLRIFNGISGCRQRSWIQKLFDGTTFIRLLHSE